MPRAALVKLHQTIKKVTRDIENLSYNTAIAALMELSNELRAAPAITRFAREAFVLMLAPFAPHLAEELWARLGNAPSVFHARWPEFVEALTVADEIELGVQVNGKLRDRFTIAREAGEEALREAALGCEKIRPLVEGKTIARVIIVPGRLVNIIVK